MSNLSHCVYFTLNDNSDTKVESLIAAGERYLKPHDGIVYYSMGRRHPEMQREVNDQTFDVSLIVVFDTQASHDAYQVSDPHAEFIADQKANWKQVRVFDASVMS
ncbi:MAG: Dabb family protein [Pirellulaceae bacterium]